MDAAIHILPCNVKTVRLFIGMGTQWRMGMNGAYGLDYSALPVVAQALGVRLRPGRFEGLRIMEAEVLRRWERRRE